MARIRSIHPNACTSEKLSVASAEAERCYWRLQTHCDDEGRCQDHPRLIWAALFPLHETVTPTDVDLWLKELDTIGLIVRYVVGEKRYLEVTAWADFQHPNRPTQSKFPPPHAQGSEAAVSSGGALTPGEGVEREKELEGEKLRKRRPPKDFQPSEEHRTYASEHGLDLLGERDGWVLWCEANGRTYSVLNAGFSTWLRNAVRFGGGGKALDWDAA
jgi:hypothetical protein